MIKIPFLDSHTGGEPTRLITSLPFDLGTGSVADKLSTLKAHHDDLRRTVLLEPRGSDVLVGAYLVPPADPTCQFGVIYFNNVGYLGMCGHGTIGLIASLAYLGRVQPGVIRVETPVGVVEATLHDMSLRGERQLDEATSPSTGGLLRADEHRPRNDMYPNRVSVKNIPAYRHLTHGITGANGAEVDHVELFAAADEADSKSFVLCPGKAYDRSPCGTGTSAKLACLYGDGKLQVGQTWKQQSVVGSIFEGSVQLDGDKIIPTITGEAWVMAEGVILVDERDPFGKGI